MKKLLLGAMTVVWIILAPFIGTAEKSTHSNICPSARRCPRCKATMSGDTCSRCGTHTGGFFW